ncbi:squalene--hopene cyclase [Bacillus sp. H-16]|nr:squalene--hopene cyclase [Alteribacter salitolerans]
MNGGFFLHNLVTSAINQIIDDLRSRQSNDGSWRFCFETGTLTDAYTIILLRSLEQPDSEWLIERLTARILSKQEANGAWKLFADQNDGHLSSTAESFFALLYSGHVKPDAPHMKRARKFIQARGGLAKTGPFTRAMLAMNGQISWPKLFNVPIETILLPRTSPISIYDIVGYSRVHLVAVLTSANMKYSRQNARTPNLRDLLTERKTENEWENDQSRSILTIIQNEVSKLIDTPKRLRKTAFEQAEQHMLKRIEPDGLYYSYITSTFFMIYAFLALGYKKDHPVIQNAVNGIKNQVCLTTSHSHIEFATSTAWDSALISHALQQSGVPASDPLIKTANAYLLSRQHTLYGDWSFNNPNTVPGGWGFSDINTFLPDVDDTTAALRAIKRTVREHPMYRPAWSRGADWILSMQNKDGGWGAFEKATDKKRITLVPFPEAGRVLIDPSTADLTGRALEFLAKDANLLSPHPAIDRAVNWLEQNQETDGSWYGRWGVCYIYGTWAALTGLDAAGFSQNRPSVKKAVDWLSSIQNEDGGWGESCVSDTRKTYMPLGSSTLSQTAWAVDALTATHKKPADAVRRGVNYLVSNLNRNDWTTTYPTGAALPGDFYIYYHSYNYIWPLLALSNFRNKFDS